MRQFERLHGFENDHDGADSLRDRFRRAQQIIESEVVSIQQQLELPLHCMWEPTIVHILCVDFGQGRLRSCANDLLNMAPWRRVQRVA